MTFYSILGTKYVLYSTMVQSSQIVSAELLQIFRLSMYTSGTDTE